MRILMLSIAVLLTALGAYAQGTVHFANIGVGLNALVFDLDGVTKLAGPAFQAQLYVGGNSSESTLIAVPGTTVFYSGESAGYFNAGTKTLPGFPAGSRPFFQVRAWEAAGGTSYEAALAAGQKVGKSAVFQIGEDLGDSILPGRPATLIGLTSFSLVPEPPTVALGAVSGAVLLLLGRVSKTMRRSARPASGSSCRSRPTTLWRQPTTDAFTTAPPAIPISITCHR